MSPTRLDLDDLSCDAVPGPVPYAVVVPEEHGVGDPLPLCVMLHGGGGSRDALIAQQPLLDELFATGALPPMVVGMASTGEMSFYLDHPDGKERWEHFVADVFLEHLRQRYAVRRDADGTVLHGASMGGWGSLKIAFARPERFAAVAVLEPAVEPALRNADTRTRNRFFHGQTQNPLLGEDRDAAYWEANNPATRAVANADAIRDSGLAIYLEVGDEDVLNLHDGTEYLHRVLWDLDIPHEYHLVRGADHVGPSLNGRLVESLVWLGSALSRRATSDTAAATTAAGRAWMDWADRGFSGDPPEEPLDMMSAEAVTVLRAQFGGAIEEAAKVDPTMARRLGKLPPTS